MSTTSAQAGFALAAALHLGFQATVTLLVYPALARTPPEDWRAVHARHSRSIAPVVGVVYGALVLTAVWVLLTGLDGLWALALAGALLAGLATAVGAAPAHGRLGRLDPHGAPWAATMTRLQRFDALRLLGALVAALTAAYGLLA